MSVLEMVKVRAPEWLKKTCDPGPNALPMNTSTFLTAAELVSGEDSVTAAYTDSGKRFYAGYVNGYVSYGSMVARPPGAVVMSITVRPGVYGVDVIDVEPGCCTISEAVAFMEHS